MRHTRWREEMHHEHGTDNPRQGASWRWERAPPQKPSYLKGDLVSRAARNEYVTGMNAQRMLLSAQAVQRDLAALVATLHAAVKAEQATRALHQIMKFLQVRNSAQFCANSAQFSDTSSLRVDGANLRRSRPTRRSRCSTASSRSSASSATCGSTAGEGLRLGKVALREMLQARPPATRPPPPPLTTPCPRPSRSDARATPGRRSTLARRRRGRSPSSTTRGGARYGPRPLVPQLVFEHSDAQTRRAFANGGELPVRKPRKGLLSFEGAPASEAPPPPGPTGLEPGRASGGATPRAPPGLRAAQVGDRAERVADAAVDGEGRRRRRDRCRRRRCR